MADINLGSFNSSNGSTTGFGIISGFDADSLIESVLSAKQSSVTAIEDNIAVNDSKVSAVGEMRTLIDRFKTTVDFLRAPPGVGNENNDFFKYRLATLTSSTSIASSTYLSVTSEAGSTLNDYDITDIVLAKSQQIRKDGFSSQTASVVGNASVTDNYQVDLGSSVAGTVLNPATPITFSNDVQDSKASIDVVFGDQNLFGTTDEFTVDGTTTITFGGGGGNDIDISGAATVAEKIALIAARLNEVTTGNVPLYTYTANDSTLTITRDTAGSDAEVGTDLAITADFSVEAGDTTQTVKIGSQLADNAPVGGALNSLGTDGNQGTVATNAVLELFFGDQNQFDATDEVSFGSTTITFGGAGGDDIDISSATTLDDKIDAIVNRMNAVATGDESLYTYSRDTTGVLTVTRDTAGSIATAGSDITVSADFSQGTADTTQTVGIGKLYENNGSVSGSVAPSNSSVSGSVSENGVDGLDGATKASVTIQIANNSIDTNDTIRFDSSTLVTFGTDVTVGGTLEETLQNLADFMNNLTSGVASGYTYTTNGSDSLIVTRDVYGDNDTVTTNLAIDADFSLGADNLNTVKIGSGLALNDPAATTLIAAGTDGVNQTSVTDAKTTHISTLSGAVAIDSVNFIAGSNTASSFTPNVLEFKATVGGVTYTSKPVVLDGGSVDGNGDGTGGVGNRIPAGTVITFVKDTDSEATDGTKDVTFNLVVGSEKLIADSGAADTYATEIDDFLNSDNTITITQNPAIPEFRAGTFTLGGANITLEDGDNLQVIKSKINAVSSTSGVISDIIKVGDDDFSLILKSTNTGIENKIAEYGDGDPNDPLSGTIQIGLDNVAFTSVQAASDASFSIDGLSLTRSTNVINDAIDKLTFTLISDTPVSSPPTLNVSIDNNPEVIKAGVVDFLNAYNDLKFFISEQSERDVNNDLVEGAVLGDDSILRDVLNGLDSELNRLVSGITSGNPDSLFAVGIDTIDFPGSADTPETNNIFVLDESKFDSAIASDFEAFRDVFTFSFSANSPELSVFSRTNALSLTDFKLDIDTSRDSGNQVRVLDSSGEFLFNADLLNNSIVGQDGTGLEGLVMVYTGDGTDTITVNTTQGIADRLFNTVNEYLAEDTGIFDTIVESFTTENERFTDRIDRENIRISIERQLLVDQFTQLEAIISQANSVLSFIEEQSNADNSN